MSKPVSYIRSYPRLWQTLLIGLVIIHVVLRGGITLIYRLAPFWGGNDFLLSFGSILTGLSIVMIIGGWGFLVFQLLQSRSWRNLIGSFLIPLLGTFFSILILVWQTRLYQVLTWPGVTWSSFFRELNDDLAFPTLAILGFWLWVTLFLMTSAQSGQRSEGASRLQQVPWYSKVLVIALLMVGLTIFSESYQHIGPFQTLYGNVCGHGGQESGSCVATVTGGGFPLPYLLDSYSVSAIGSLNYGDDDFESAFFFMDLFGYGVVLWGGLSVTEQVARRRNLSSPATFSV